MMLMIIVFNFEYVTFIEKLKAKFEFISLSNSQNLLILKDSYLNINHVDMNVDDWNFLHHSVLLFQNGYGPFFT